jgi:hypothetical protein
MAARTHRPTQVYLRPEQLAALKHLSEQRKVPVAQLVREGVDRVLADVPWDQDPLWQIVGIADSDVTDLAEKHDEYLVKWEHERNH